MITHTFAICAYKDSPYLEECIRSLKQQTYPTKVILCTSTPSAYLSELADRYTLPLYVREGESNIAADWNFAYACAESDLVTIAHQDDRYHKDYALYVQKCWERYADATVFMSDCAILKNGVIKKPGLVHGIKVLLRLPLRFSAWCDRSLVKKAALCFGNPIICPSCTYNKRLLGEPLFDSPYSFALDWDTMWKLAERKGRFVCVERPLIAYRIHGEATTKKCIENNARFADEAAMFAKIWPKPIVTLLMFFYRKAATAYDDAQE